MTIPRNLSNLAPGASSSGVLDTAHGGTGTSTTFTQGSIPFAGASGVYSQDNAQLFWDDTNNRLGVGTATPGEQVSITASAPTFSMSTPVDGNRVEQRYYNDGTLIWTVGLNYSGSDGHYFFQRDFGGGNVIFAPDGNGAVGIGASNVAAGTALQVNGGELLINGTSGNIATLRYAYSGTNTATTYWSDSVSRLISSINSTGAFQWSSNSTQWMLLDTTGQLGIGTNSPAAKLHLYDATSVASLVQGDGTASSVVSAASNNAVGPFLQLLKYRGSHSSPNVVQNGDITGRMMFYGYDGSALQTTAEIRSYVDGTPGASDMPGGLAFYTTANGAATSTQRVAIGNDGLITLSSAGLQISSTGVTSPASTDGNVFSGTYTPSQVSTNTNVSAVTFGACQYIRVGNMVTVSGNIVITATAATTNTVMKFSLPIASNFTAASSVAGAGSTASGTYGTFSAAIIGDGTNKCVEMRLQAGATAAWTWTFSFTYRII